jgi:photosystem II stability/assembly factor-like uncharacterized protein
MKKYLLLLIIILGSLNSLRSQWSAVNVNTILNPRKIEFISDSVGFLVDYENLYKTTDQGSNWNLFGQVPWSGSNSGYYDDACFIGDSIIIALTRNTYLYKSLDGGNTWTIILSIVPNSEYMTHIDFVNSQRGYIISHNLGASNGYGNLFIHKTIDGGVSWQKDTFLYAKYARGIKFTSQDTGFAVASTNGNGYLLKTYNGGLNWTTTVLTNIGELQDLYFLNNDTGFVIGNTNNGVEILKTNDAGNTWIPISPGHTLPQYTNLWDNLLWSICFTSPDTGYVGGSSGRFLYTTDGGTSWMPQHKSFRTQDIYFVNPDIGFIVGESSNLLKTTSKGIGHHTSISKKLQSENDFSFYPNPNRGLLNVQIQHEGNVSVISLSGKEILNKYLHSGIHKIMLNGIKPGTYLINYRNEAGRMKVEKLVIY